MMIIFIAKKFITQYFEKILLASLSFILIVTVLNSTFSLFHEIGHQEVIARPSGTTNANPQLAFISPERYTNLMKKVQLSMEVSKEPFRNIFEKGTQQPLSLQTVQENKLDRDQDQIPDEWEIRYGLDPNNAKDAQEDLDKDSYSNLDEYIGGSDPADSNSFPGALKLRVLKIFRKEVRVNFFGYIKLPNGQNQIQINWGKRTAFLEVGNEIRGYKITGFFPVIEKRFNPQINDDENIDNSYITIQKMNDSPITLTIGKPSFEKELYVSIQDLSSNQIFTVHTGSKIKSYKIVDISTSKVIISQNKKIYTLSVERKR